MAQRVGASRMVPYTDVGRLTKIGIQRIGVVYQMLRERVSFFVPICDLLRDSLLLPVMSGQKLRMKQPKRGVVGSFLSRIQDATEDTTVEDPSLEGAEEHSAEEPGAEEPGAEEDMFD